MGFTTDNIEITSGGFRVKVVFKTMEAKDFIKRVRDAVAPEMEDTANTIVADASANAPVGNNNDPRVLSESITQKQNKRGVGFKIRTNTKKGAGRTGYGADIEFGDSRIAAQPFLYPAYDRAMNGLLGRLRDVL